MLERGFPVDESELERGVLEDRAEHVGEVVEDHGAPGVILEIDEVSGGPGNVLAWARYSWSAAASLRMATLIMAGRSGG